MEELGLGRFFVVGSAGWVSARFLWLRGEEEGGWLVVGGGW